MRYLLDTNVCVDFLNGRHPSVTSRLLARRPDQLTMSAIAVAALRFGAEKSARPNENHRRLDLLLEELPALKFDLAAAAAYGSLRTKLEPRGEPSGRASDRKLAYVSRCSIRGELTRMTTR